MRPLQVRDVKLRITPHPSFSSSAAGSGSTTSSVVNLTSLFPTHAPSASLDDICVIVQTSPAEDLLYNSRALASAEQTILQNWLSHSVSFSFLRRLSTLLSLALAEEDETESAQYLEERARLVAVAMGIRAMNAAEATQGDDEKRAEQSRVSKLISERKETALQKENIDEQIESCAEIDEESRDILTAERRELVRSIIIISAELAGYGFAEPALTPEEEREEQRDANNYLPPVTELPSLYESESDTDESDYVLAKRIEDDQILLEQSEGRCYTSSDTDEDYEQAHGYFGSEKMTVNAADFVIDLEKEGENTKRKVALRLPKGVGAPKQADCQFSLPGHRFGFEELEELGLASSVWRKMIARNKSQIHPMSSETGFHKKTHEEQAEAKPAKKTLITSLRSVESEEGERILF